MTTPNSRYALMTESNVTDVYKKSADTYPDCLTLFTKLKEFTQSAPPIHYEITSLFLQIPYLITYQVYNQTTYEDTLLLLNGVSYITELQEGETLYIPVLNDMTSLFTKYSTVGGSL